MDKSEIQNTLKNYCNTQRKLYKQATNEYKRTHKFSDLMTIVDIGIRLHKITIEEATTIWKNEIKEVKKNESKIK